MSKITGDNCVICGEHIPINYVRLITEIEDKYYSICMKCEDKTKEIKEWRESMSEDKVREINQNPRRVGYNKTVVEEALERQIVRNTEILQEQRRDIEELKSRMKREAILRGDWHKKTMPKFDYLKELFEDLINIIDQEFAIGQVTVETMDRVDNVRKNYEQLMRRSVNDD